MKVSTLVTFTSEHDFSSSRFDHSDCETENCAECSGGATFRSMILKQQEKTVGRRNLSPRGLERLIVKAGLRYNEGGK